ncbi:unnamed protein product, partial [Discosporangium mesarthrocarpum]
MGNVPSEDASEGGAEREAGEDEACIVPFLDGERWIDVQGKPNFPQLIQTKLLDPCFQAALALRPLPKSSWDIPWLEPQDNEARISAQVAVEALEDPVESTVQAADIGEGGEEAPEDVKAERGLHQPSDLDGGDESWLHVCRDAYLRELHSESFPPPAFSNVMEYRMVAVRAMQTAVHKQRRAEAHTPQKVACAPPPRTADESSDVHLACIMSRVGLEALRMVMDAAAAPVGEGGKGCGDAAAANPVIVEGPLRVLAPMVERLKPLCFFKECSRLGVVPEADVELDDSTALANTEEAENPARNALDGSPYTHWLSRLKPSYSTWTASLRKPSELSAVVLAWPELGLGDGGGGGTTASLISASRGQTWVG